MAIQTDAAELGALHVACWHETYSGILPPAMLTGVSVVARTAMWCKILGAPDDFGCTAVFVVEDGGRIVGFGSCGRQRDAALVNAGFSGEISAIYVRRAHQGRGVGRSIITAMAHALSALGHSAVGVWVLRENGPARAFYERLGGDVVGEKIDDRPHGALIEVAYGWRDLSLSVGDRA